MIVFKQEQIMNDICLNTYDVSGWNCSVIGQQSAPFVTQTSIGVSVVRVELLHYSTARYCCVVSYSLKQCLVKDFVLIRSDIPWASMHGLVLLSGSSTLLVTLRSPPLFLSGFRRER